MKAFGRTWELAPGRRPFVGNYVMVRSGKYSGTGGKVLTYARSKFAPPLKAYEYSDGLRDYYVAVKPELGDVFSVSATLVDVYTEVPA